MPPATARGPFAPIDIAWLVCFRILFGGMLFIEAIHYLLQGWPRKHYDPAYFHFTFAGFHWVRPWPGEWGVSIHFAFFGLCGLLVALGLFYRVAAALLFVAFTYVFLLDKTYYLNHFYLICLLAFLMVFLPAHRAGSLDARRRPALRADTVPAWTLWPIRFQIGVVYVFGGVAKLGPDWLRGEPMRLWLSNRATDWPTLAPVFRHDATPYLFSYGGLLLDLLIVPALMWRRTRIPAVVAAAAFHLLNSIIFDIGIFPWLMLGATIVFFEPDWTRRLLARFRRRRKRDESQGFGVVFPASSPERGQKGVRPPFGRAGEDGGEEAVVRTIDVAHSSTENERAPHPTSTLNTGERRVVLAALALWISAQILIPFRHWLYPGPVNWTEEGHRFSWHMKLRDKQGSCVFLLKDPVTGRVEELDPADALTPRQARLTAVHPEFALQYARHLADERVRAGKPRPVVHVRGTASLNDRKGQPIIDPTVDLASVDAPPLAHWTWILPLTEPLKTDHARTPERSGADDASP